MNPDPGRPLAVVAGHVCLDIIPLLPAAELRAVLRPGALMEVGAATLAPGGAVANTGRALRRLGIPTRLVGKVGDDELGAATVRLLSDPHSGGADHLAVEPGAPGSYSIVLSPPGGDRSFLHFAGPNDTFGCDDVGDEVLRGARLFHLGYPPLMRRTYQDGGSELLRLYRRARRAGAVTTLDLAMPDPAGSSGAPDWAALLARVGPEVDVLLPSVDELALMLDRRAALPVADADVPSLGARALGMGVGAVVLKLGARGIYLRTSAAGLPGAGAGWRSRELWLPALEVTAVGGTTGAGDAAAAGFLAAFLRGQGPEAALRSAAALGAYCVEAVDSAGGIAGWDETQDRLRAGWPLAGRAPDVPRPWAEDRDGLWHGPVDLGRRRE